MSSRNEPLVQGLTNHRPQGPRFLNSRNQVSFKVRVPLNLVSPKRGAPRGTTV